MDRWQKIGIVVGACLLSSISFCAGQDWRDFDDKWDACVAQGGTGFTKSQTPPQCYKKSYFLLAPH